MKKRGKIIYVSYDSFKGLESVGKKYISKRFLNNNKKISYNKSIQFMLELIKVSEKLSPISDKEEAESDEEE